MGNRGTRTARHQVEQLESRTLLASIGSHTTISANIGTPNEVDAYTFNVTAGKRVLLTMVGAGNTQPFAADLEITGPNGAQVIRRSGGDVADVEFTAAASGTYKANARSSFGYTGKYKLRMVAMTSTTLNADPADGNGGLLANRTTKSGTISDAGDFDVFRFSATKDRRILLSVSDVGEDPLYNSFVPQATVYGPNGVVAKWDFSDDTLGSNSFYAPATGSYNVVVRGYKTGAYQFQFAEIGAGTVGADPADGDGGVLVHGATVNAAIDATGDFDLFQFTGTQRQNVSLTMVYPNPTGTTAPQTSLHVYKSDGELVREITDSNFVTLQFQLPETGTYYVVASDPSTRTGSYKLRFNRFASSAYATDADGDGGFLTSNVARAAKLNDAGDTDVYGFYVGAGDFINLRVTGASGVTGKLYVFDPAGQLLTDSIGYASTTIPTQTGGLYAAMVVGGNVRDLTYSIRLNLTHYDWNASRVSVQTIDPLAAEPGTDTGTIRFSRAVNRAYPIVVNYTLGGSALHGTDYQSLSRQITIPANASYADLKITPKSDSVTEGSENVTVTLASGTNYLVTYEAAMKIAAVTIAPSGTGKISGAVFNDADNDGIKDTTEAGLVGRRVFVDGDNDGVWDINERSVLTATGGAYAFTNLPAGTFRVRQVLTSGEKTTAPAIGYHAFTLAASQVVSGKNFGAARPVAFTSRVNATATAITLADGRTFAAGSGFTGGTSVSTAFAVGNTTDDNLYYTLRTGADFSFARTVPNGSYSIQLFFADPSSTATGQRKFDVFAEGTKSIADLDLFVAAAGAKNAYSRVIPVNVTDGQLNLRFLGKVGNAVLSAIVIAPRYEAETAVRTGAVVASGNAGFTGTGYVDFTAAGQTLTFTANTTVAGKYQLRFRYANGATTNQPLKLEVNGVVKATALAFNPTGSATTYKEVSITVDLVLGSNTIKLTSAGNGVNLDSLIVA